VPEVQERGSPSPWLADFLRDDFEEDLSPVSSGPGFPRGGTVAATTAEVPAMGHGFGHPTPPQLPPWTRGYGKSVLESSRQVACRIRPMRREPIVAGLKPRLLLACVRAVAPSASTPASLADVKQIAIAGVTGGESRAGRRKDAAVADATVVISGDRIVCRWLARIDRRCRPAQCGSMGAASG